MEPNMEASTAAKAKPAPKPAATANYEVFEEVKLLRVEGGDPLDELFANLKIEGDTLVVLVPRGVHEARSQDDACWKVAENDEDVRSRATAASGTVLRAGNVKRGGLSDPKPYKLEQTVKRVG